MTTYDRILMTGFLLLVLCVLLAINTKGKALEVVKWVTVGLCCALFAWMIYGVWIGAGPFGWGGR